MTDTSTDPDRTPDPQVSKREIPEHYRDLFQLYSELGDEVQFLIKSSGPDISQVTSIQRRLLVRSVFAFIEAIVHSIKNVAAKRTGTSLPPADEMLTSETSYELSDSGKVVKRSARLRLVGNIRYAFSFFKDRFSISSDLDVAGNGWQSFLRSIKVRDRLTHPKRSSDIEVSDTELLEVVEVFEWFQKSFAVVLYEAIGSVNATIREREEQIATIKKQTIVTTGWTSKE